MKKEIRYAVFVISLFIFAAVSFQAQDASLPSLRGGAAVEKLKQAGQYENLKEAVTAARGESGRAAANVFTETSKLLAADGAAGDDFGFSVSIDSNTAIAGAWAGNVGTNSNQGSVYVFFRTGTAWTLQQKLTASDGAENDGFGVSVAIDGDTIIVGAWHDNVGINIGQGSAYVFTRSGTTWTEQQKLLASDGLETDNFGKSVAIDGNTAIIGAPQDDVDNHGESGSAYVFVRSGTVWTQQAHLFASDGAHQDIFYAVAISGDTALVGAYGDDIGANGNQGSAYVFVRSGTVWTQQQKLTASDGAAGDSFGNGGWSVAIDGNTAVIGATQDDVGGNMDQGSAYVFVRSGTTWTEQAHLFSPDGATLSNFGSVAIEGNTILAGGSGTNIGLNQGVGAAYVFVRNGTVWTMQKQLIASDGAEADHLGFSVAISGNKIFAGAYQANIGTANDQGTAYVFISKVSLSGRVLTNGGYGVAKATVQITLANGETRYTLTTPFGYYRFDEIEADQTATVSVVSKQLQFTPQMVTLDNNIANLDFTAQ
jgi:hypothetical protein